MSLFEKIKAIYPQMTHEDWIPYILLRHDGQGAYIAKWDHPTLARPTDEQLGAQE